MTAPKAPGDSRDAMSTGTSFTTVETALITEARQKSTRMRTETRLPKHRSVSLLVTGGSLKGKTFPVQKPQVLLGRSGADIEIPDTKVSRRHCVLEVHDTYALLVDLESVNGTQMNGKKVTSCQLEHMDEFQIGNTTIMFAVSGSRV